MKIIAIAAIILAVGAGIALQNGQAQSKGKNTKVESASPKRKDKVVMSEEAWKKKLTEEQYKILRGHGTEAAFCGVFHNFKDKGVYFCVGCELPLFRADDKFDSGTGWPSFFQPYAKDSTWLKLDTSYGMVRQEVLCSRCDGHLGHVFDDGPKPTGLRFCINSEVLKFKSYEELKKAGKGGS
ncbi:MAG: peptide-methionine (R)-S-oxide reductase MsrB [Fimbriimonadaceae bacterium]